MIFFQIRPRLLILCQCHPKIIAVSICIVTRLLDILGKLVEGISPTSDWSAALPSATHRPAQSLKRPSVIDCCAYPCGPLEFPPVGFSDPIWHPELLRHLLSKSGGSDLPLDPILKIPVIIYQSSHSQDASEHLALCDPYESLPWQVQQANEVHKYC